MNNRNKAWSDEEDQCLAETVLKHIREDSTQTKAFEAVSQLLKRTSAACGYRWNSVLRNKYKQEIYLAKKKKTGQNHSDIPKDDKAPQDISSKRDKQHEYSLKQSSIHFTIDDCIEYLKQYSSFSNYENLQNENEKLQQENKRLLEEKNQQSLKYDKLIKRKQQMEQEYGILMNLLRQAQKLSKDTIEHKEQIH